MAGAISTSQSINVENLPAGVYILSVNDKQSVRFVKLQSYKVIELYS